MAKGATAVCVGADPDRAAAILLEHGFRRTGGDSRVLVAPNEARVRVVTTAADFARLVRRAAQVFVTPDMVRADESLRRAVAEVADQARNGGHPKVVPVGLDRDPGRTHPGRSGVDEALFHVDRGPLAAQYTAPVAPAHVEIHGKRVEVRRRRTVAHDLHASGDIDSQALAACEWFVGQVEAAQRAGSVPAVSLDGTGGGDPTECRGVRMVMAGEELRWSLRGVLGLASPDSLSGYVALATLVEGKSMQEVIDAPSRWRQKLKNRQMVKGIVLSVIDAIARAAPKAFDAA